MDETALYNVDINPITVVHKTRSKTVQEKDSNLYVRAGASCYWSDVPVSDIRPAVGPVGHKFGVQWFDIRRLPHAPPLWSGRGSQNNES